MELLLSGQFLSVSRRYPQQLPVGQAITLNNGIILTIKSPGVIVFEPPQKSTKNIILSSGVHGNETAPIEICDDLVRQIILQQIIPQHRVMFIFGNLPAMDIGKRFVQENLNRLFDENITPTHPESIRAISLMKDVDEFFAAGVSERQGHANEGTSIHEQINIHYDLHTAIRDSKNEKFVVYPFLYGREYNKEQLQFLSACDVNTVLLAQDPTTTFSHYSSKKHEAHAFTVELGKVKPFGQNDMSRFENAKKMLTQLITMPKPTLNSYADCPIEVFKVSQEIIKQRDDFTLHFAADVANFTQYNQGDLLASESGTEYRVKHPQEAIVFPNANVEIGQRALLTVIPCDI